MLSPEENQLLTRTGPGTPMGDLIRRFWIPALFSHQLPDADGVPLQLKLLGESLVAFRDSDGKVGLLDERCPHRGASLYFGRNEESGLRCVYHGWKFDRDGRCVDMPSEPAGSSFVHKVSLAAYPCIERGGMIWAYMGPSQHRPAFPDIEWTLVPASHRYATRHLQECNWFQALEGGYDVSHLNFLHRGGTRERALSTEFEVLRTEFGFVAGAGRKDADGSTTWLASVLLMPFHKLIGRHAGLDSPIGAHAWVPIDDENCMIYSIEYHPERPLQEEEMLRSKRWDYIHAELIPGTDRAVLNKDNDYMIDRALQASGRSFTGIRGFGIQDCGIQESMGPIADRTREHLGRSDLVITRLRRLMLQALRDLESGEALPGESPGSYRVRSVTFATCGAETFVEKVHDHIMADAKAESVEF